MGTYHPMGKSDRGRGGVGCLLVLLIVGLVGGSVFFVANSVLNTNDDLIDSALNDFATTQAIMNSSTATPNSGENAATAATEATLFPTPDLSTQAGQERFIYFPQADTVGRIVTAVRVPGGWDITYLQNLVGHLEGTSWLGESGNTVLAGHFEDQVGVPGPFRYLYAAEIGDEIIIEDRATDEILVYEVIDVFTTSPDDLEVLRHTDSPRLTLITCDNWNPDRETYTERVVVIAAPVGERQEAPDDIGDSDNDSQASTGSITSGES
jgi:LPXTG-site transpeptidase (sortase) family protein